jgi:hypothetical protein
MPATPLCQVGGGGDMAENGRFSGAQTSVTSSNFLEHSAERFCLFSGLVFRRRAARRRRWRAFDVLECRQTSANLL